MFGQPTVSFAEQDVAVFSDASGDRNPLHLSPDYARRTPYGRPVVFGCLGALACLSHVHLPTGWSATSLEAEFGSPLFLGVRYRVETSEKEGRWRARLFDGSAPVVSVTVTAELSNGNETLEDIVAAPVFERVWQGLPGPVTCVVKLWLPQEHCQTFFCGVLNPQPFWSSCLAWG